MTPAKNIRTGIFAAETAMDRLIPRCNSYSIEEGVKAKTKDPLWFLSRQWQMGRFRASNSGHVVRCEVSEETRQLDEVRLSNDAPPVTGEALTQPLESLIENESGTSKPDAWDPAALSYRFSIKCQGTPLECNDYDGEGVEWFDLVLSGDAAPDGRETVHAATPVAVSFPGMPNPRWWKFEESSIDLGELKRPNLNFIAMLLSEFALIYSNDWFIVPLKQKTGSLRRVTCVKVIDSFGVTREIPPVRDESRAASGFSVFTLSSKAGVMPGDSSLLFLPNNSVAALSGEPVEQVSVSRDEKSNLVWAVEHTYSDGTGIVNRDDAEAQNVPDLPEVNDSPLYRLRTELPANWIPYIAKAHPEKGLVLRRARTVEDDSVKQYRGKIIADSIRINNAVVGDVTLELTRKHKTASFGKARWSLVKDGSGKWTLRQSGSRKLAQWTSRDKTPGKKQGQLNLRYDYLLEK